MQNENQVPQNALDLYRKAKEAFEVNNKDYALTLLRNLLKTYPDFSKARSLLRVITLKGLEGKSKSMIEKMVYEIIFIPFYLLCMFHLTRKKWASAIDTLESMLKMNPAHAFSLRKLASCTMNLGWTETAKDTLEILKKITPLPPKELKSLAHLYMKEGELEKARRSFEEYLRSFPEDENVRKALQDLAAMKTISQGGWDEGTTYRQKIQDEKEAERLEKESKFVKTKDDRGLLIEDLKQKLQTQPDHTTWLRNLAQLYEQNKQNDEAILVLEKLRELLPSDGSIPQQINKIKGLHLEEKIAQLKTRTLKNTPHPHSFELEQLESQKKEINLEEGKRQVERYPHNLTYRYELGCLYYESGQFQNAIQEFQQSVKDAQKRVESFYHLGRCFHEMGFYDIAEKQFLKVVDELTEMDTFKKDVIYHLGLVYEATHQIEKAMVEYKKIFEVDIGYKDVSQKINKAYKR
ncbi:MAG: tetratricopeptide repeat protein [Chlamydiae bacterium]|nr:tetratricopeptide repeat protein [Chlamydiota bacterium]MBI3277195.1 tetratricopeptide repeat protein [Chlamydiota bacterium]